MWGVGTNLGTAEMLVLGFGGRVWTVLSDAPPYPPRIALL
jgi:hypothetical protein